MPALVLVAGTTPWLTDGAHALAEPLPRGQVRRLDGQTHDVAPDVLANVLLELTR